MISDLLSVLSQFVINIISGLGYPGIFVCMLIESALIPLPSEVIMPFSGFLVAAGRFNFWLVGVVGALGNVAGSLLAYGFGYWGHDKLVRPFVRKWGKFLLITEEEYDKATDWVKRKGALVSFTSRLLPGVRTVISLPVGVAHYDLKKFILYTFLGSFIWSLILVLIGKTLGEHWDKIGGIFHKFDIVIILIILGLIAFYIYRRLKHRHSKT